MDRLAVHTINLTRYFDGVCAVNSLDLEIPSGTVFGFLGPNGAGKTTTIRLLLGLLEPTAGNAEVLGFDILTQADKIRERSGALLEHHGLYERMSAEDNLEFYARVWRLPPQERKSRIQSLLSHLELWDRRKEPVGNWSRGMKQKLAVARALIHRPALLFLDEPTSGLDPIAAAKLHEDLLSLVKKEGVTVFLTTHNLSEAEKLCQQIGIISKGKLIACGTPAELRSQVGKPRLEIVGRGLNQDMVAQIESRPEVESVKLTDGRLVINFNHPVESSPLVSWLVGQGIQVEEVLKSKSSLEEVFLSLINQDELRSGEDHDQ